MLGLLASLAVAASAPAPVVVVDGTVSDALFVGGRVHEIWLTASDAKGRRIVRVDERAQSAGGNVAVPADAIFVDACAGGALFADARGLVDANGTRIVDARALFTVPDPSALFVADLCGKAGDGKSELRVPVVDGILVKRGAQSETLALKHEARAYSGRVHRGLRPDRGYGEALSLYGPRLLDVDVDGDGKTDLVAVREGRITVFRRNDDGALATNAAVDRDWSNAFGGGDVDLRIRLADVDGDQKADAIIGVTRGAVPEKSEAYLVQSDARSLLSTQRLLWKREGLVAPIGARGKSLVVAEVDTSLVSLSAVVLTGRIPVKVSVEGHEPLAMQAKVDVRAGRMDGALPVVDVDFDGDGVPDLLDLGEPGKASLHKGTATGFALDAAAEWDVPAFVHVVAMPELPGVVLVGAPARGKTSVAILARPASERAAR